ncbi:hypothetical protein [Segnochrobactrum spirostomi]|uniref:Uncharacterized protein n=1 Tax=Segnochrobactrum spirostomi TaxID=2608987 RepID=A0A6A7Y224_9HYPH|nr:hypothetical protein [Segnochrobactrum spirostomi]MQT12765.1 hypothetical protein [Segnochrobactrum spirostomi]
MPKRHRPTARCLAVGVALMVTGAASVAAAEPSVTPASTGWAIIPVAIPPGDRGAVESELDAVLDGTAAGRTAVIDLDSGSRLTIVVENEGAAPDCRRFTYKYETAIGAALRVRGARCQLADGTWLATSPDQVAMAPGAAELMQLPVVAARPPAPAAATPAPAPPTAPPSTRPAPGPAVAATSLKAPGRILLPFIGNGMTTGSGGDDEAVRIMRRLRYLAGGTGTPTPTALRIAAADFAADEGVAAPRTVADLLPLLRSADQRSQADPACTATAGATAAVLCARVR